MRHLLVHWRERKAIKITLNSEMLMLPFQYLCNRVKEAHWLSILSLANGRCPTANKHCSQLTEPLGLLLVLQSSPLHSSKFWNWLTIQDRTYSICTLCYSEVCFCAFTVCHKNRLLLTLTCTKHQRKQFTKVHKPWSLINIINWPPYHMHMAQWSICGLPYRVLKSFDVTQNCATKLMFLFSP